MENRNLIKNISLASMIFLLIVGIIILYWLYSIFYSQPIKIEDKSTTTVIDDKLLQQISNTKSYGTKVTPEEPGYGRINPFVPYKEPPVVPTDTTATTSGTTIPK